MNYELLMLNNFRYLTFFMYFCAPERKVLCYELRRIAGREERRKTI